VAPLIGERTVVVLNLCIRVLLRVTSLDADAEIPTHLLIWPARRRRRGYRLFLVFFFGRLARSDAVGWLR
jgi:hypothetical protein